MEVFMLPKLILKQQNHSQLYVAQHILHYIDVIGVVTLSLGKRQIIKKSIRKMLFHLNFLATIHQLYYYKY